MENKVTEAARRWYNRIAPVYELMERAIERSRYSRCREMLWSRVEGNDALEVGVGTGKHFSYYPENADVIAIDFSKKLPSRGMAKAQKQKVNVHLKQMDVQSLEFEETPLTLLLPHSSSVLFPTQSAA